MKHFLHIFLFIIVAKLSSLPAAAQQSAAGPDTVADSLWAYYLPQHISAAIAAGKPDDLDAFVSSNIELTITSKSGIFSHKQAMVILHDFFESITPTSFDIVHERCLDSATLTIGTLRSGDRQYRVYILTNSENNKLSIQQLRIEKQDD